MALLSVSGGKKSFGAQELFHGVSFTIENHHHIGLVGINGSGKTTLMKILQGEMDFDEGEIYRAKNTVMGYVEQFICEEEERTVYEEALMAKKEMLQREEQLKEMQERIERGEQPVEPLLIQKNRLEEEFVAKGGYTFRSMTKATLKGLGLREEECQLLVGQLSGGQKTKLMLAKMLLSDANLLLLDEPTNHLDIDAIEWLENFLLSFRGSYLVISHDRYFLDKVTQETFELEHHKLSIYAGNYTKYLQLKEEKNKTLSRKTETTEKEIARIEGIIAQQKTWSQERNYKIIKTKQKMIDRLEASIERPDAPTEKMQFHFHTIAGGNQEVLSVKDLSKSFGTHLLFQNVSLQVLKQERVFLIGPNGCGKTTLLKILQHQLPQDSGTFHIGSNIQTAFYSQTQEEFVENKTVLEYVWGKHPGMNQTEVRKALAIFLFKGDDVNHNILTLSGGEKARLSLLLMMLSAANFLVLDEPTNHLDIQAREALEEALSEYEGTLFIVSHDRYLMNKLATKIYRLEKEGAKEFIGNYDTYISQYIPPTIEKVKKGSSQKIAYQEKKEREAQERKRKNRLVKLEDEIAKREATIKQLGDELFKEENVSDYQKVLELHETMESEKRQLDELYIEWSTLMENNPAT